MSSRMFFSVSLCIGASITVSACLGQSSQPAGNDRSSSRPPNIVLVLADDLGYGDLGCYGSTQVHTPVIDRLAGQGVRCTQFYVSTPVCAPTRVSLMTGRYPARTSLNSNPDWKGPQSGLDPSEVTIAEVLKTRAYKTGIVGKWHLGYDQRFWPRRQGFDEYVGFISGWADYYTHNYRPEAGNWMVRNDERRDEKGYMTDVLTREAISFVERHAKDDTPFFLYVAYNAPHAPIEPPPGCNESDPGEIYNSIIEHLDMKLGEMLTAIDRQGIADQTLFIFMSDNGAEVGSGTNEPLRGRKRSIYEGGIRVPFIARYPGHISAGSTSSEIGVSMDLYATFAGLAGAELPAGVVIDGNDILPVLAGKGRSPHANSPLFWAFGQQDAVREGRWKLVRDKGKPIGLYDIPADAGETHDLSAQEPAQVKTLSEKMDAWRKSMRNPAASG